MSTPRYVVEKSTATVQPDSADPDNWIEVPAWKITRIQNQMGWHINTYLDKATADSVASILNLLAGKEPQ